MAVLAANHCPLCGVFVKPENLTKHIERVHPRYSYGVAKVPIDFRTCPICGRTNDPSKTKYGLSICTRHYVKNIRRFLIKDFYVKLKERNSRELASNPDVVFWMINLQLHAINTLLGWEPEKVGDEQFLAFTETSAFTGYLLLRVIETVPEVKEIMYSVAESDEPVQIPRKLKSKIAKILLLMDGEFELFVATKFAVNGYYDIAVDDEASLKLILIVPIPLEESIKRLLLFRLKDANEQWHGTLRKILVPYGTSTAKDELGASFSFDRGKIKDHFEVFKAIWNEVFQTDTKMTASDFEKLWDWLEWVISQDGVTEKKQEKATYFKDYQDFGLKKSLVFKTLEEVLPEVHERIDLISSKELSKFDLNLTVIFRLADLARGFRVSSSKGLVYYFPCRKWFYNKVMPVFVRFARKLELAGESFEKDIALLSTFYSKVGIKPGGKSALGIMIEPRLKEKAQGKTSRSIPWRILEKNFSINLPENEISSKIGRSGEIDLIVYANMNLYLIEMKALNLESRHAIKYMREKAPVQCAKYAEWIRNTEELEKLLQKHGIKEHQLNSVRIVICSSGVFQDLVANCEETDEYFAIVPEYILFSTMAGLFTLSLKDPFPSRIETVAPGIKITNPNVSQVKRVDVDKVLGKKISERLIRWTKLITFDRRQRFGDLNVDENVARAFNFFGTFVMNEAYLSDTVSWVLPKPLLIDQNGRYKFYIGTQLGDAGTTIVCENCKSAIKYYWPQNENKDSRKIEMIFKASICPLCGKVVKELEETEKVRMGMTMIMSKFKHEIGQAFE